MIHSLKSLKLLYLMVRLIIIIILVDLNAFNKRAEIKILNQENIYISQTSIDREIVVLTCVSFSFFVVYTS